MRTSIDDRRLAYCDIFPEIGKGDINISVINPGVAIFWHKHLKQDDYMFVIKGSLKVGICNAPKCSIHDESAHPLRFDLLGHWQKDRTKITCSSTTPLSTIKLLGPWPEDKGEVKWHILCENNTMNGPLFIPRTLWHGNYNYTNEPAILIYHITNKWDSSDEQRASVELMGWDYKTEIK